MAKKTGRRKVKNLILGLVFLLGLLVLAYPLISRFYYRIEANYQVADFHEGLDQIDEEEIQRRMDLARAYNANLNNQIEGDPYSEEMLDKARKEYARMLEVNEKIGVVEIPKIDTKLPIYAGTDEEILQKGAGHMEGTSLPIGGNSSHSVITAHSGLPEARLFSDLHRLEIGDKFYIHNIEGVLAYQVDDIKIIEPHEFDHLLIFPGHDYLTLLTCTPIMINSHRLLVRGHQVPYVPAVEERIIAENMTSNLFRYLFIISVFIIIVLIIIILRLRKRKKTIEKKYNILKDKECPSKFTDKKDE